MQIAQAHKVLTASLSLSPGPASGVFRRTVTRGAPAGVDASAVFVYPEHRAAGQCPPGRSYDGAWRQVKAAAVNLMFTLQEVSLTH
ncbi:hypothetical protein NDU88_001446 [Pleurodeles waltl]|uniref:Uncharacterized protein n=1 Tax=Pleurodeles waltl TaxID=8319 RepID=A0AAV7UA79_PLEWA|nr:hypothetical protein NDU88_001446 [Pleurodeles waltl]